MNRCFLGLLVTSALAPWCAGETLLVPKQFPTIQAAVDAAVGGDVVSVGPGVYAESVSIVGKAITLRGKGAKSIIEGRKNGLSIGACVVVTNAPGAVVENLTVRLATGSGDNGMGVRAFSDDVTVRKVRALACATTGILVVGAVATVDGCDVENCEGGIQITSVGGLVTGCAVRRDGSVGFMVSGQACTVRKCVVDTIEDGEGIRLDASMSGVVDCKVRNVADNAGVRLSSNFQSATNVDVRQIGDENAGIAVMGANSLVLNSRVRDCNGEGIAIFVGASTCEVRGNTIERAGTDENPGLLDEGVGSVIEDNVVLDSDGHGIWLTKANAVCAGNRVERSRLDGIHLNSGLAGVQLTDNVVRSQHGEGLDLRSIPATMTGNTAIKNRTDFVTTVNGFTLPATNVAATSGSPQVD